MNQSDHQEKNPFQTAILASKMSKDISSRLEIPRESRIDSIPLENGESIGLQNFLDAIDEYSAKAVQLLPVN